MSLVLRNPVKILYGGTFDPPHFGHLYPLQSAADMLGITKISLLPAYIPVFKPHVSDAHHRVAMVKLLSHLDPRLDVDLSELNRDTPSFTIDTLKALKDVSPKLKLVFVIGQDSLKHIHKWREWRDIFDYCHILVMGRPDADNSISNKLASKLYKFHTEQGVLDDIVGSEMDVSSKLYLSSKLAPVSVVKQCDNDTAFMDIISTLTEGNLWLVRNVNLAISSTQIRAKIRAKEDISKWVPASIIEYINEHHLFSSTH